MAEISYGATAFRRLSSSMPVWLYLRFTLA